MAYRVKVWSFSATGEDGNRYEVSVYAEFTDAAATRERDRTAAPTHVYELADGSSVIQLPDGGFQVANSGVRLKLA